MIPKSKIRAKVSELLTRFRITEPPVDVEKIAKNLGIRVEFIDFDKDEISGLLVRKGKKTVLGVNRKHSENRQRFTIAHEIGHFLLHKTKPIFVDELALHFRTQISGEGINPEEIEANALAAELLMPRQFIEEDVANIDVLNEKAIQDLAQKYKVSVEAFVFRLTNLGYKPYFF